MMELSERFMSHKNTGQSPYGGCDIEFTVDVSGIATVMAANISLDM